MKLCKFYTIPINDTNQKNIKYFFKSSYNKKVQFLTNHTSEILKGVLMLIRKWVRKIFRMYAFNKSST